MTAVHQFIPDCGVTCGVERGEGSGRVMVLCNGNYATLSDNDSNGALQVQNLT